MAEPFVAVQSGTMLSSPRLLWAVLALLVALPVGAARAQPSRGDAVPALSPDTFRLNDPARSVALRARLELGSIAVMAHHIRYGTTTRVDYRKDGDQDTLFFFMRMSAELGIRRHHTVVFLYQPLRLQTESTPGRSLQIGEVPFEARAPLRFGYGFDFYRLAYQYDFYPDARRELALGAGFQIRNARVSFIAADGARGFTQTDLGFVPLLRLRGGYVFDSAAFVEAELDGWVSPVPGQGRAGELALGAIVDVALRAGVIVTRSLETFLSLRYLGGGFRGESGRRDPLVGSDRWSENWLHTLTFSLGLGLR